MSLKWLRDHDARFDGYAEPEPMSGCWIWTGQTRQWKLTPYGIIYVRGKRLSVHRYAYERFRGPIPEGYTIDHLCRNSLCVNPRHLEAVTNRENVLRGVGPTAVNAAKSECNRGHPFTPENTYLDRLGKRYCKTCDAERHRRRYQEKKHG